MKMGLHTWKKGQGAMPIFASFSLRTEQIYLYTEWLKPLLKICSVSSQKIQRALSMETTPTRKQGDGTGEEVCV